MSGDRHGAVPWAKDNIVCVFSSTKIPTIICTLMAIDRGLLDLDTIALLDIDRHTHRVHSFLVEQLGGVE